MKKNAFLAATLFAAMSTFTACSSDDNSNGNNPEVEVIDPASLPRAAATFLSTTFGSDVQPMETKKNAKPGNPFGSYYTHSFKHKSDRLSFDFDKSGRWTEVESDDDRPIPTAFLEKEVPAIYKYITENFGGRIVEIDREDRRYEVEVKGSKFGDIDVYFDKDQNFLAYSLDDDNDDDYNQYKKVTDLPKSSTTFIQNNFPNNEVVLVKMDDDHDDDNDFDDDYFEVVLKGGVKIEFNKEGEWLEIENKSRRDVFANVKEEALVNIVNHVKERYQGYYITDIEKEFDGRRLKEFEVEIEKRNGDDDKDLDFDAKGMRK